MALTGRASIRVRSGRNATESAVCRARGTDEYIRYGNAYFKHNDGTLDVIRTGVQRPYSYASGEWADVEGDEKRFKKRFWG
jgi:hypothetical protein